MVCSYVTVYSSVCICVFHVQIFNKNEINKSNCPYPMFFFSFLIFGEGLPSHLKTVRGSKLARMSEFEERCVIEHRSESRLHLVPQNLGQARSKILL